MLYTIIDQTIIKEVDEQIINVYKRVAKELQEGKKVNFPPLVETREIQNDNPKQGFKNILLKSGNDGMEEPFRQYSSVVSINGKNIEVIVRISLIEKEDMLLAIFTITIGAIFLLLLMMFLITKYSSQKVFRDFFITLKKLENFSLTKKDSLELDKSNIEEFNMLNMAIQKLSEVARSEYKSLKEFTEETNHEIQTPIAVIKSKLELLLQRNKLTQDNSSVLNTALKNLSRLERINKSILLLNKLEHNDLFDSEGINLSSDIMNVIIDYNDFIAFKNLSVNVSMEDNFFVQANRSLMGILLSNLISNAIKHNIKNGTINVELKNKALIISNSGVIPRIDTQKFFNRFYKESISTESIGLGLTIVKKICNLYHFEIRNEYKDDLHRVILQFPL